MEEKEEGADVQDMEELNLEEMREEPRPVPGPSRPTSKIVHVPAERQRPEITPEIFKELIRERKAERKRIAEEKRQQDLRRIRDMNSRSGIHPLALFPKEIWLMILEEVKNPQDLAKLYSIHEAFRDLLEENLIGGILFPMVLDKIPLIEPSEDDPDLLNMTQLMILRQMSKSLRDAVDKHIQNHLLKRMRDLDFHWELNSVRLQMTEDIAELNNILVFSSGPVEERPQRFFLRSLHISFSPYNYEGIFYIRHLGQRDNVQRPRPPLPELFSALKNNVTELLETIGSQILHFHFEIEGVDLLEVSLTQIYRILREWLGLLPNLKWLKLSFCLDRLDELPGPGRQNQIADRILQEEPMPKLNDLERVDLFSEEGYAIWNAVLSANPHVKYYNPDLVNRRNIYSHECVLTLALETADIGDSWNKYCDLPLLQNISLNNHWNLKKLNLEMGVKPMSSENSIQAVFQCLHRFPTVEILSLRMDPILIGEDIDFLRLQNLKEFKFTFGPSGQFLKYPKAYHFFFSLQFLLYCEKLEKLTWINMKYDARTIQSHLDRLKRNEDGMIEFGGGFRDLSQSNIWNVFPLMKCVRVAFRVGANEKKRKYFRREYCRRELLRDNKDKWGLVSLFFV